MGKTLPGTGHVKTSSQAFSGRSQHIAKSLGHKVLVKHTYSVGAKKWGPTLVSRPCSPQHPLLCSPAQDGQVLYNHNIGLSCPTLAPPHCTRPHDLSTMNKCERCPSKETASISCTCCRSNALNSSHLPTVSCFFFSKCSRLEQQYQSDRLLLHIDTKTTFAFPCGVPEFIPGPNHSPKM